MTKYKPSGFLMNIFQKGTHPRESDIATKGEYSTLSLAQGASHFIRPVRVFSPKEKLSDSSHRVLHDPTSFKQELTILFVEQFCHFRPVKPMSHYFVNRVTFLRTLKRCQKRFEIIESLLSASQRVAEVQT
jgi:hypothetical protein